jgi:hypothetical protein
MHKSETNDENENKMLNYKGGNWIGKDKII